MNRHLFSQVTILYSTLLYAALHILLGQTTESKGIKGGLNRVLKEGCYSGMKYMKKDFFPLVKGPYIEKKKDKNLLINQRLFISFGNGAVYLFSNICCRARK